MKGFMDTRVNSIEQIERALHLLTSHGYGTQPLWHEHNAFLRGLQDMKPTEEDRKWCQRGRESLAEHLNDAGTFPVLSARNATLGRQYQLSKFQRDVLRERWGMTPAREVEVVQLETFAGEDVIMCLVLRSCEHVDLARRKHVMREVVLKPAWDFFASAARLEAEHIEQLEVDRMAARVQRVIDKAKEMGVRHNLTAAGDIAHQLHAECSASNAQSSEEVRDQLRQVLTARGHHGLAALVKSGSVSIEDPTSKATRATRSAVSLALDYINL